MTKPEQHGSVATLGLMWIELGGNLCRLLVVLAVVPALIGGYVFLSQVVLWFKTGIWVSLPLLYVFTDFWPVVGARFTPDELDRISASGGYVSDPLSLVSNFHLSSEFPGFASWLAASGTAGGLHKVTRWVLEALPITLAMIAFTLLMVVILLLCSASARHKVERSQGRIEADERVDR
jgi:hypothetical protein